MKKLLSKLTIVSLFSLFLLTPFIIPSTTISAISESTKQAACDGIALNGEECSGTSGSSVSDLIASVINIFSWIVGIAAVIMIIVGGFKYVISNGDSNSVSSAKSTIMYALIGLVVAVLAQVIVQFVLKKTTTTDATATQFSQVIIRDA